MNPFLGQSPFADPAYLNNLIEHLKQHQTLWYLNRCNGYVQQAPGKPVDDYSDPNLTQVIDKVYTTVGAHVMLDTQQVFGQFAQAFQNLIQMAQQRNQQPMPLPPDAQVVKDTSMAETQRRQARDQAELQLKDKELAAKIQMDMAELQQRQQRDMEEMQLKLAIATGDNEMKERIETARLTRDAAKLNFEQSKAVPTTGGQYGNE